MSRRVLKVGIAIYASLVICEPLLAEKTHWLRYYYSRDPERETGVPPSNQRLEVLRQNPDLPPQAVVAERVAAKWKTPMVKAGFLWVVLGRSKRNGRYDLLFMDTDGDGSLRDEAPIKPHHASLRRNGNEQFASFGPAKVLLESKEGTVVYHLNVHLQCTPDRTEVDVSYGGWYDGMVRAGDKLLYCMVVDSNSNGAFDDASTDFDRADRIWLAPKHKLGQRAERGPPDLRLVGKYVQIDGKLYSLVIARDGAWVKLSRSDKVTVGSVRVPSGVNYFSAGGPAGLFEFKNVAGIVKLPVGTYRVDEWRTSQRDELGAVWEMIGRKFPDKGIFKVEPIKEIAIKVGEPATHVSARREGRTHHFTLLGGLGERVSVRRDGREPKASTFLITSRDKSYHRRFSFEYG